MKKLICFLFGHKMVIHRQISIFMTVRQYRECERCGLKYGMPHCETPPMPHAKTATSKL